ncbi:MAG: PQQ-binding-like beta-propeller repeat protein [Pyrinomonadaceae bacterium]
MKRYYLLRFFFLPVVLFVSAAGVRAQAWTTKLDKPVRFYQTTDMGVVIVGTEKSIYAVDGATGDVLWRRKDTELGENDVAPVPGSDLLLLSFEKGERTRLEAVDIMTGNRIWRSEKIRGGLMQMAVHPDANLLALVLAKNAKGDAGDSIKRHPLVHVLNLSSGDELWKNELNEVEMIASRWPDGNREVEYTFDNYHAPVFADRRLYLFYEGLTSFDGQTGKSRLREKYRVNEEGFALTEADPIFAEGIIYTSSHGRVRAISRGSGDTVWEAKDLGLTPEMILVGETLYVRTGGQFTRLKDGDTVEKGPFGVSAIDTRKGRVLWRYKGADKGITNLVLPDAQTIMIADRDDLISIDANTGKRRARFRHAIERASFGLINEGGNVVVGGQNELAAFEPVSGRELWRARHTPPGRGILRTVAAVAARAASLYFRYGGMASTAFRGIQIARVASSLSFSGLVARSSVSNLQALATSSARNYATRYAASRFRAFGMLARVRGNLPSGSGVPSLPSIPSAPSLPSAGDLVRDRTVDIARNQTSDVDERLLDKLDPAHQLDRLSRFLWHRDRLAALRGQWMYFYTDLKGRDGNGLAGVNINNGQTDREIRLRDLDERFITDEPLGLLYAASGNRIIGYALGNVR